jgi:hypothetical protein
MHMPTLYVTMEDGLFVFREASGQWTLEQRLGGLSVRCVAADPSHLERIYAGTDGRGLWRSRDGGRSWAAAGTGIRWPDVTAVAVGEAQSGAFGTVYAGTEPSSVFRSTDGGESWEELEGLARLPSAWQLTWAARAGVRSPRVRLASCGRRRCGPTGPREGSSATANQCPGDVIAALSIRRRLVRQ